MAKGLSAAKYDRIAFVYDLLVPPAEGEHFKAMRRGLLSSLHDRVLEVGVGTGINLPYYPRGVDLSAIDISGKMLARAREKADRLSIPVKLEVMDVEDLRFPDSHFDFVVSTFVFCSVADPLKGLREVRRVVKDEGSVIFIEHVRSEGQIAGRLMDWLSPIPRFLIGDSINRRTEEIIEDAGLELVYVEPRDSGILRKIIARPTNGVKAGITSSEADNARPPQ